MSIRRPLNLVGVQCVLFLALVFSGPAYSQNPPPTASSPEEKIKVLEKTVSELQESNAMLMENLAECIDENSALSGKDEKANATAGKLRLIQDLRRTLHTDEDLDFLSKLSEGQLRILLEAAQDRPQ